MTFVIIELCKGDARTSQRLQAKCQLASNCQNRSIFTANHGRTIGYRDIQQTYTIQLGWVQDESQPSRCHQFQCTSVIDTLCLCKVYANVVLHRRSHHTAEATACSELSRRTTGCSSCASAYRHAIHTQSIPTTTYTNDSDVGRCWPTSSTTWRCPHTAPATHSTCDSSTSAAKARSGSRLA